MLLVLFMIFLAMLYTRTFYGMTGLFRRLSLPHHFRPAIGAFLTGLVGFLLYYAFGRDQTVLAVLAFGYGSVQQAMNDGAAMSAWVLLAIALGKILTTSLTIGSGGSGGVFGPSMVIGGCGGGALGIALHHLWPGLVPNPASFVIVGMAGFFAAAAKTPFSTLIIVSEMTGGYHLLLPALWVCVLAFLLSDEKSIYSAQMESRSRSPAHRGSFVRDVLGEVRVGQFFIPGQVLTALRPDDSMETILARLDDSQHPVLPVVDQRNRLLGVVDLEEVHLAAQASHAQTLVVAEDLMRTDVTPLAPEDRLDRALELFIEHDLLSLPVVNDLRHRIGAGDDTTTGDWQCLRPPCSRAVDAERRGQSRRIGRRPSQRSGSAQLRPCPPISPPPSALGVARSREPSRCGCVPRAQHRRSAFPGSRTPRRGMREHGWPRRCGLL